MLYSNIYVRTGCNIYMKPSMKVCTPVVLQYHWDWVCQQPAGSAFSTESILLFHMR